MSDKDNIFSSDQDTVVKPTEGTDSVDLSGIVGDGAKYKTADEALKSIPHREQHVATLEGENATLRAQMEELKAKFENRDQLEDVLNELKNLKSTTAREPEKVDIAKMVEDHITAREKAATAKQNVSKVVDTLVTKLGSKDAAEKFYRDKADELGVGVQFLNTMASQSPTAVFELLGVNKEPRKDFKKLESDSFSTATLSTNRNSNEGHRKVMLGGSTADAVAEWKRHAPNV